VAFRDDGVAPGVYYSERFGAVWMIALQGEFDLDSLSVVQKVTRDVLGSFDGPLVFDLALVTFCDSALLNHLVHTAAGRPTALVHAGPAVGRLLEITGTGHLFRPYEDLVGLNTDPDL
jgi:anti-anti-sigma factor